MVKEKMIGKVAVCCKGVAGVITSFRSNKSGEYFEGYKLNGHGRWISRKPLVIANSVEHLAAKRKKLYE